MFFKRKRNTWREDIDYIVLNVIKQRDGRGRLFQNCFLPFAGPLVLTVNRNNTNWLVFNGKDFISLKCK